MLQRLNRTAEKNNYNRTIMPAGIDSLAEDAIIAIAPIIIHEHAQGQPVEPHLRCSVQLVHPKAVPWGGLMLDVPMDLFSALPTKQDLVKEPA
jgi:hypothetical protein